MPSALQVIHDPVVSGAVIQVLRQELPHYLPDTRRRRHIEVLHPAELRGVIIHVLYRDRQVSLGG